MSTELVPTGQGNVQKFTKQDLDILRKSFAKDLSEAEFQVFVKYCMERRLNPFTKQIVPIKFKGTMSMIVTIDGYRAIANRTGQMDGSEITLNIDDDGKIISAVACVYKKGCSRPFMAEAFMEEYLGNGPIWQKMPRVMISKCAEALALRKAFPEDLSGVYSQEEMGIDRVQDNGNPDALAVEIQPVKQGEPLSPKDANIQKGMTLPKQPDRNHDDDMETPF